MSTVDPNFIESMIAFANGNIGLFFAIWFYLDMRTEWKQINENLVELKHSIEDMCKTWGNALDKS